MVLTLLWEFEGYEAGFGCSDIGERVGEASGDPLNISGFLMDFSRGLALDVTSEIEIGEGDDQVGSFVFVARERGTGGQTNFRGADFVLDEKDFLRGVGRWSVVGAGGVIGFTKELDGDVAEGLIGEIAGGVRETSHEEAGISVLEFELDWRFAGDCIFDFGIA